MVCGMSSKKENYNTADEITPEMVAAAFAVLGQDGAVLRKRLEEWQQAGTANYEVIGFKPPEPPLNEPDVMITLHFLRDGKYAASGMISVRYGWARFDATHKENSCKCEATEGWSAVLMGGIDKEIMHVQKECKPAALRQYRLG